MLPSGAAATPKGSEKLAENAAPSLTADRPVPARTATRATHPASSACSRAGSMKRRQTRNAATHRIASAAIVSQSQRRDLPRSDIISGSSDGLTGLSATWGLYEMQPRRHEDTERTDRDSGLGARGSGEHPTRRHINSDLL